MRERKYYDTTFLNSLGIDLKRDSFYILNNAQVVALVEAARNSGYRKPRNANGSTARYFYALLQRQDTKGKG